MLITFTQFKLAMDDNYPYKHPLLQMVEPTVLNMPVFTASFYHFYLVWYHKLNFQTVQTSRMSRNMKSTLKYFAFIFNLLIIILINNYDSW